MRRRVLLVAMVLAAVAGGVVAVAAIDERDEAVRVVAADFGVRGDGESGAIVPLPVVTGFRAGEAVVAGLEAFTSPAPPAGTAPALVAANPTHEGFPLVVSVIEATPDGAWLNVRLPQRPNGTTGWVRASDVRAWEVPNRIEVTISTSTLRVYAGQTDEVLFEASVSAGSDATPTPVGEFFIDIVNPLGNDRTYGWGQLSVSGFSEVLERFAGGIGQIAIHGWNGPSTVGRNVSNGCIRMNNEDIARVAELAPLGTPVEVVP